MKSGCLLRKRERNNCLNFPFHVFVKITFEFEKVQNKRKNLLENWDGIAGMTGMFVKNEWVTKISHNTIFPFLLWFSLVELMIFTKQILVRTPKCEQKRENRRIWVWKFIARLLGQAILTLIVRFCVCAFCDSHINVIL